MSIRMKFAEAFSSEHIKRHINSLLICLCLAKLCMEISIHFCHPHHDQSETPAILHSEILNINRYMYESVPVYIFVRSFVFTCSFGRESDVRSEQALQSGSVAS